MKSCVVIIPFAAALALASACGGSGAGDNDDQMGELVAPSPRQVVVTPTPEDESEGLPLLSGASVTLTSEGAIVDPQQVDFGFLFLTMSNETDEVRSVRVSIQGYGEEVLEFGLAPGETRDEFVETDFEGPLRVYWDDGMLHIESVDGPPPSPSPELLACPSGDDARAGYVDGYFDGFIIESESGRLLEDSYMGDYSSGYREGYVEGVSDGHFGRPKEIGEDLRDYVVAYARGYEDGHEDGYSLTTSSLSPQEYREHYFHGFFDAILGEGNLCGS